MANNSHDFENDVLVLLYDYVHLNSTYLTFFVAIRSLRSAKARLSYDSGVCLSVCPSHSGIGSKRMNVGLCNFHRWVSQ